MAKDERLAELEKRVVELESGGKSREEIRLLWNQVREETDVDKLLKTLQTTTSYRTAPKRARVHGVIDDVLANDGNVQFATPTTIILTSSEPCVILAVTVITLTVCDEEPPPVIAQPRGRDPGDARP